jgi:hypothetical protein
MTDQTKSITADFKARNGRRVTRSFPECALTAAEFNDPKARAAAINYVSDYGFGRGWRLVNWTIG